MLTEDDWLLQVEQCDIVGQLLLLVVALVHQLGVYLHLLSAGLLLIPDGVGAGHHREVGAATVSRCKSSDARLLFQERHIHLNVNRVTFI